MEIKSQIPNILYIERSVFEQFMDHTRRKSENEWGGLLIGREINGKTLCIAAVLPPQKSQSPGYCEFKREIFQVIRNALDDIEEKFNDDNFNIMTWIHTHPDLGVFLSSTDQDTYSYLAKLNPSLSAIVVDPVKYEWLAVNSILGNQDGFTRIELDLNNLYKFDDPEKNIIEKLKLFQHSINNKRNRKLFKLKESEKIEVFIPIPFEKLKNKLIMSSLTYLKKQLKKVSLSIFNQKSDTKIIIPEEKNPEIKKLIEYLSYFRAFEQEIKRWNRFSINQKLYERELEFLNQYMPTFPLEPMKNNLLVLGAALKCIPIFHISLWDDFMQFGNDLFSKKIPWSSIKKMCIDDLYKDHHVISYKTGIFSRWKRILVYDPFFERLKTVLKRKLALSFNQNPKLRKKYVNLLKKVKKEREKQISKIQIKDLEKDKKMKSDNESSS